VTKYETALRKVSDADYNEIAMYLAKVLFDTDDREGAKKLLRSILHRDPANETAWYHLAVAQENNAIKILKKQPQTRTMEEAELAIDDLKQALAIFKRLSGRGQPARKSRCLKHAAWCKKTLQAGDEHLRWHRAQHDQVVKRRTQEQQKVKDYLKHKKQEEEKRRIAEQERKEALLRQAQQNREKADVFAQEMKDNKEARKRAKEQRIAAKKDKNQEEGPEEGEGEEFDVAAEVAAEAAMEAEYGTDFGAEEPEVGTKRKADEQFEQPPPKKKKKKKKKKLTQREDEDDLPPEMVEEIQPKKKKKKKKKGLEYNFDDRSAWNDLMLQLYNRITTIIKEGDVQELSRKSIRETCAREIDQEISEYKGFIKQAIAHIVLELHPPQ